MNAKDIVNKLLNEDEGRTWEEVADRIQELAGNEESGHDIDDLGTFSQEFLHTGSGFIGSEHSPEDNLYYAELIANAKIEDLDDIDMDMAGRIIQLARELMRILTAAGIQMPDDPRNSNDDDRR
jgi:hypothetical protein